MHGNAGRETSICITNDKKEEKKKDNNGRKKESEQ